MDTKSRDATPITLALGLLPDGGDRLTGFPQFWLRYVHGFSPHFHCQKSLRGFNDPRFKRDMQLGVPLDLLPPVRYDYVYLCGVTSSGHPGLHLALMPDPSATARLITYNGIEVIVSGARQLHIPALSDGYAGMTRAFTTCVNWQFGVRYYGLDNMRRELL